MPAPRKISTDRREFQLKKIIENFGSSKAKLDAIIFDLSKEHVDDKKTAKKLLTIAEKWRAKFN